MKNNRKTGFDTEETIRAMETIEYAWESDMELTTEEMCNHLEGLIKMVEGTYSYDDFIFMTDLPKLLNS